MRWTVSVKGVLLDGGYVLLGLNERGQWELPGGQLDGGETLHEAVEREFIEETGLTVIADELLMAETFEVLPAREVLIIAFRCSAQLQEAEIACSPEHHELAWKRVEEITELPLPAVYHRAIAAAIARPRSNRSRRADHKG